MEYHSYEVVRGMVQPDKFFEYEIKTSATNFTNSNFV